MPAFKHLGILVDAALVAASEGMGGIMRSDTLHAKSGGHKSRIYELAMIPDANTRGHDERPGERKEKAPDSIESGAFVM